MKFFDFLSRYLGALSPAQITFFTLFSGGKLIGQDMFGNRYYQMAPRQGYALPRRWVIYKGRPEASLVPPEWHGWLHHQNNTPPSPDTASFRRSWQKPHQQNLTGTIAAYRPPGHLLRGGRRDKASGDYEAWKPE
ncbi:MAG: NADH:ubiquinone oxidoreductase subunit NDUFA12 [Alphaproteobacteria bacterium]|nr:NADH:ubiquinone oxidoreductase subunit NDUFA12 [Alphaproteobacteria bacterium]